MYIFIFKFLYVSKLYSCSEKKIKKGLEILNYRDKKTELWNQTLSFLLKILKEQ